MAEVLSVDEGIKFRGVYSYCVCTTEPDGSARWEEGEQGVWKVSGFIHSAGVNICDRGERNPSDHLSCPY